MRKPIEYDKTAIQASIRELEKNGPLRNRSELWAALATRHSVSVATIAKWANGLEIQTPLGRRGGEGGDFGRSKGIKPRAAKTRKGMSEAAGLYILNNLPSYTTDQVRAKVNLLVNKAQAGSAKAALQLRCLDCVNYQTEEMRECGQENSCSLYHLRPYKGKAK